MSKSKNKGQNTNNSNGDKPQEKVQQTKNSRPPYNDHRGHKGKPTRNYSQESKRNDSDSTSYTRKPYDSVRGNDITWWNKSPMYADVTRVPFNRIYGAGVTLRLPPEFTDECTVPARIPIGGIMAIEYVPSIGSSNDATSAVNRAFNSLFGELYARTTGTPPIQQMDVAFFITSLASVASLIAVLKRALGVSQLYSNWNYNYPRALLSSMRFDPDSIIGWQDELRYALNDCILNFNNLKVPDVMDIYVRQYALAHNLYCDEDDVTSALYVFNPAGYYVYRDTATPARLEWITLPGTLTGEGIINRINECLEVWRNSSDLPLISGTIQRAFTDTQTISLDYVTEQETVTPTVDRNIMWQINNMNITPVDFDSCDITQDPVANIMRFDPTPDASYSSMVGWARTDHFLNSYDGTISDEFIMESTRLMTFANSAADGLEVSTEFVTKVTLFGMTLHETTGAPVVATTNVASDIFTNNGMNLVQFTEFALMMGLLSQFKYHPLVSLWVKGTPGPTKYTLMGQVGDLYKFTTIDNFALEGLQKAATQSVYKLYTK